MATSGSAPKTAQASDASYMLNHLRNNAEEDARLDKQHLIVRSLLYNNELLPPDVLANGIPTSVADIACGSGVFLNDISREYFANSDIKPKLIGFDVNTDRFVKVKEPGVELHEHDCKQPFPSEYHGQFDFVNIRLVWSAIRQDDLKQFLQNAIQLLKPGGYLHWLEGEFSYIKTTPVIPGFDRACEYIGQERIARGLMTHVPSYMLQVMLEMRQSSKINVARFDMVPTDNPEALNKVSDTAVADLNIVVVSAVKFLLGNTILRTEKGEGDLQHALDDMKKTESMLEEVLKEPGKYVIATWLPTILVKKDPWLA